MVMTRDYLLGAKFLKESLERHNSKYDFILFIAKDIATENELKELGFREWYYFDLLFSKGHPEFLTINKIQIFTIIPDDIKLCLLDADIQLLGNIDSYLDYPVGSAYYFSSTNHISGECMNFQHDNELYENILQLLKNETISNDEDIWNFIYNSFKNEHEKHFPLKDKYSIISHVIGGKKYWQHDFVYKVRLINTNQILYLFDLHNMHIVKLHFNLSQDSEEPNIEILDTIYF